MFRFFLSHYIYLFFILGATKLAQVRRADHGVDAFRDTEDRWAIEPVD